MQWLYKTLLDIRPAPLASAIKKILRISRKTVSTKGGFKFHVDPVSHFGCEVMQTAEYEPELAKLIQTLLRPHDTFVDVGANEGYFTVLGSYLVGKFGKVISVEPQSRLQQIIKTNCQLNQCTNVTLHRLALSHDTNPITLHLSSDMNSGSTSFYKHWRLGTHTEVVPCNTLDTLLQDVAKPIRLIKIDCEGAEALVLKGARSLLNTLSFEFISLDYHSHITGLPAAVELDKQLRTYGYQLSQAGNGVWVYHLPGLEKQLSAMGPTKPILAIT